jgi:hypothetical protein
MSYGLILLGAAVIFLLYLIYILLISLGTRR